jgi:hypothetical protein
VTFSGAADHPSFLMLLKQLVPPLSIQLSDRRSSIVKQVLLLRTLSIVSRSAPVPLLYCPGWIYYLTWWNALWWKTSHLFLCPGMSSTQCTIKRTPRWLWAMCWTIHSGNWTSSFFILHSFNILFKIKPNMFVEFQLLFKLVVITVLVIAESADTCIKTVSYHILVTVELLYVCWHTHNYIFVNTLNIHRCYLSHLFPNVE